MGTALRYEYVPTERQLVAHTSYADELLYGGAAGGGKTDYLLAEVLAVLHEFPGSNGVIFRRTFADLSRPGSIIHRLLDRLPQPPYKFNQGDHTWGLPNGSRLELAHLGADADVTKYQGAEYMIMGFDQLEQFTEFQYTYLLHRLRVSGELARVMAAKGARPRAISAANPGGIGHAWVKGRFIDPAPSETLWKPTPSIDDPNPGTRIFIPAKVSDNPHVNAGYVDVLNRLPDDQRRAMRDGDWDVYAGQRFGAWRRNVHVVAPEDMPIPEDAPRAIGVDYGLDAPFCALWGAQLADGLVVVYRELYQAGLTAGEQADAIAAAEAFGERSEKARVPVALDPASWARNPTVKSITPIRDLGLPPAGSIAGEYRARFGSALTKARNDRLAGVQLLSDKLRQRRDGLPRLLVYSTCTNLIRTLPALPRSDTNPEDVNTKAEDHAYDALRYLLMQLVGGGARAGIPELEAERDKVVSITGRLRAVGF